MGVTRGAVSKVEIVTGTYEVANIDASDMTIKTDTESYAAFDDDWDKFAALLNSGSGKFSGKFNFGDTNGQAALFTAQTTFTAVSMKFYTDRDNTHYFAATVLITSLNVGMKQKNLTTVSFDYQVTGAVTYT